MIVHELIKRYYNLNKTLTFPIIFRHLKRKGDSNSFLDYMKLYIIDPPEKLQENTIKKYQTCLVHLTKFRPAIYFNDQFAESIRLGLAIRAAGREPYPEEFAKLQTIRKMGKQSYAVGNALQLNIGQPGHSFQKLGEAVCLDVTPIHIRACYLEIRMPVGKVWRELSPDEACALALADGFKNSGEFFQFFAEICPRGTFSGNLIKW